MFYPGRPLYLNPQQRPTGSSTSTISFLGYRPQLQLGQQPPGPLHSEHGRHDLGTIATTSTDTSANNPSTIRLSNFSAFVSPTSTNSPANSNLATATNSRTIPANSNLATATNSRTIPANPNLATATNSSTRGDNNSSISNNHGPSNSTTITSTSSTTCDFSILPNFTSNLAALHITAERPTYADILKPTPRIPRHAAANRTSDNCTPRPALLHPTATAAPGAPNTRYRAATPTFSSAPHHTSQGKPTNIHPSPKPKIYYKKASKRQPPPNSANKKISQAHSATKCCFSKNTASSNSSWDFSAQHNLHQVRPTSQPIRQTPTPQNLQNLPPKEEIATTISQTAKNVHKIQRLIALKTHNLNEFKQLLKQVRSCHLAAQFLPPTIPDSAFTIMRSIEKNLEEALVYIRTRIPPTRPGYPIIRITPDCPRCHKIYIEPTLLLPPYQKAFFSDIVSLKYCDFCNYMPPELIMIVDFTDFSNKKPSPQHQETIPPPNNFVELDHCICNWTPLSSPLMLIPPEYQRPTYGCSEQCCPNCGFTPHLPTVIWPARRPSSTAV